MGRKTASFPAFRDVMEPSPTLVQVYEIQTPREALSMAGAGVDRIGSVLVSQREWKVPELRETLDEARALGLGTSLIPLFSDLSAVCRVLDFYRPEVVHFCEVLSGPRAAKAGDLVRLQEEVGRRFPGIARMRTIPFAPPGLGHRVPSLALAGLFAPVSELFLTDTVPVTVPGVRTFQDPVTGFVGITGRTCDWALARRLVRQSPIPVILAGGISPENALDAVLTTRPAGVDSCTLTNILDNRGRPVRFAKDPARVAAMVAAVRRADRLLGRARLHPLPEG